MEDEQGDELPAELDVTGLVGPYTFPDNSRRRIAAALYLGAAVLCVWLWAARHHNGVLVNGGFLPRRSWAGGGCGAGRRGASFSTRQTTRPPSAAWFSWTVWTAGSWPISSRTTPRTGPSSAGDMDRQHPVTRLSGRWPAS